MLFRITPNIARDFSVLIQLCGMSCASFTIIFMRVVCEWRALIICIVSSLLGLVVGLEFIDPYLEPTTKTLGFVCIWFAFSVVVLILIIKRVKTNLTVADWCVWKVGAFCLTGFVGGIFTALVGSGLDICSYSVMTLLFRVNEKVATPTSVIMMAANSFFCVLWRVIVIRQLTAEVSF